MENKSEFEKPISCADFDALLSDALDNRLDDTQALRFHAHTADCQICGPMFAEILSGLNWMKALKEVEPPVSLLHNILAKTSEAKAPRAERLAPSHTKRRGWIPSLLAPVLTPRFATSFSMAFFSITLLLNVAGVRISDVKKVDLRPGSLKMQYYQTSARVLKYYENIRIVYELESKLRELKRDSGSQEPPPPDRKKEHRRDDTSDNESVHPQQQNYGYGNMPARFDQIFRLNRWQAISEGERENS